MKWCVCASDATQLFSLRNWLRDHTSWAHCEIGVKIERHLKSNLHLFWISLHQGTLSCSLFLKLRRYMQSHMSEVDPFIFRCVFLYEIQNCVFHVFLQYKFQFMIVRTNVTTLTPQKWKIGTNLGTLVFLRTNLVSDFGFCLNKEQFG